MFVLLSGWLALFGIVLILAVFSSLGEWLVVKAYATWRYPRSSFVDDRGKGRVSNLLYGVIIWLLGTAAASAVTGQLLAQVTSLTGHVSQSDFASASILMLIISSVFRIIQTVEDYRHHRRMTDFRNWVRIARKNALAHAYRLYYVGLRLRSANRAMSIVHVQLMFVLFLWMPDIQDNQTNTISSRRLIVFLMATASFVIIRRIVLATWSIVRPDIELISICTGPLNPSETTSTWGGDLAVRPGRWRNNGHQTSFRVADLVERCLLPMRRRFCGRDMDTISLAGRKIAESLRSNWTRISDDQEQADLFSIRKILAVLIVTSNDPVSVAALSTDFTDSESEPPSLARRRSTRIASAANDVVTRYWPSVRILLVVLALSILVLFRRYTEVTALLGK